MNQAVIVYGVGKRFRRYHAHRPRTIMEAALSLGKRMRPKGSFWALKNVNFTVEPGQMLGILGHNGAGKSTLLRLIGGVGRPDTGTIKVNGRIGALLELGAGFHPDLTGRENVFVSAAISGLTRQETERSFDDIVAFSELEKFIDSPLRAYSTGMQMRLAFAIAVHTNPDVMLVDEVLAVGDVAFQSKCIKRIKELQHNGCAILFISHSPEQIQQLCDQAIWLKAGQVVAQGVPDIVAGQYNSEMRAQTIQKTPVGEVQKTNSGVELELSKNRFGSLEAEIKSVQLVPGIEINPGEDLSIEILYQLNVAVEATAFIMTITNEEGESLHNSSTDLIPVIDIPVNEQQELKLHLDNLNLSPGKYFVDIGMYDKSWSYAYDYHWHVYAFTIATRQDDVILQNVPVRWEMNSPEMSLTSK
ncbi:ABC-type polysaccharide/polyol phosphate transport system, ATPase component [Leptolyngbya sp. PCC 7375]|nr:ABC-type polysaccharide/polyol phosphate transport system, ATPase component [Leptolyngbya sp. PCC 7375]